MDSGVSSADQPHDVPTVIMHRCPDCNAPHPPPCASTLLRSAGLTACGSESDEAVDNETAAPTWSAGADTAVEALCNDWHFDPNLDVPDNERAMGM